MAVVTNSQNSNPLITRNGDQNSNNQKYKKRRNMNKIIALPAIGNLTISGISKSISEINTMMSTGVSSSKPFPSKKENKWRRSQLTMMMDIDSL